jgi:hypothetical protein
MCSITKETLENSSIFTLINCCKKTGNHLIIEDGHVSEVVLAVDYVQA